jgi:hypothetical protein
MHVRIAMLLAVVVILFAPQARAEKRGKSQEQKHRERIEELQKKLVRRKAHPNPTAETAFLHQQAELLIRAAAGAPQQEYQFNRIARAADDLLECTERIFRAGAPPKRHENNEDPEERRREAARDLQKHYFRLQQADYFARLSGDAHSADYIRISRALYQQARAAYDKRLYQKAEDLGSAAARIVSALENLAQARVNVPDPPRLEE